MKRTTTMLVKPVSVDCIINSDQWIFHARVSHHIGLPGTAERWCVLSTHPIKGPSWLLNFTGPKVLPMLCEVFVASFRMLDVPLVQQCMQTSGSTNILEPATTSIRAIPVVRGPADHRRTFKVSSKRCRICSRMARGLVLGGTDWACHRALSTGSRGLICGCTHSK